MRILLMKVRKTTPFILLEPVIVEPLELEYIQTALDSEGRIITIFDQTFQKTSYKKEIKKLTPQVIIMNGYITAKEEIIKRAKWIKDYNNNIVVIVGGVYCQCNPQEFVNDNIDYVVTTPQLEVLNELVSSIENKTTIHCNIIGEEHFYNKYPLIQPKRNYVAKYMEKTRYLNYEKVAMVQSSISCPYDCNYCFCKAINNGVYIKRNFKQAFLEMKNIEAEYFWFIDDNLLITEEDGEMFIKEAEECSFSKKIIAYLRADYIRKYPNIIKKLSTVGVIDIIVGLEAVSDITLNDYNKTTSVEDNIKTIEILRETYINLTALFIVSPWDTKADFKALRNFIKQQKIKTYTISIFTPMKGANNYKEFESEITRFEGKYYDFLHLVIPAYNMSNLRFYLEFYWSYTYSLKHSKNLWRFVIKRLCDIIKGKW